MYACKVCHILSFLKEELSKNIGPYKQFNTALVTTGRLRALVYMTYTALSKSGVMP